MLSLSRTQWLPACSGGIDAKGLAAAILDKVVVRLCSEIREEQLVEAFITKHAQSLSERLSKRLVEQLVSDV